MTNLNPDINVPVTEPQYTATKAIHASWVLAGAWIALVVKSMADGGISWAEGYEIIGGAVAAGGAILAVFRSRNVPK